VFRRTPFQRVFIAIYATFAAEVGESAIVDVQHWRHFYLLIGLLWGLMALRTTVAQQLPSRDRGFVGRNAAQHG